MTSAIPYLKRRLFRCLSAEDWAGVRDKAIAIIAMMELEEDEAAVPDPAENDHS